MRYDVAVIGGGLSGLTASIYLARAGLSVVVLEQAKRLGGRAITNIKNGASLNLGGHALYRGGAADTVLSELGVSLKGAYPPASAAAIRRGQAYTLPTSPGQLLASKLLSVPEKVELTRLMFKLNRINPDTIGPISLRDWAEREIAYPLLRQVVYAVCQTTTYCPNPELLLAVPAVRQLQRAFTGKAFYLDRGWGVLVEDLAAQAVQDGVRVLVGQRAVSVEPHDVMGHRILRADGEPIEASSVLIAASPKATYDLVKGADRTVLAKWRDQAGPMRTASLDLVLRRLPPGGTNHIVGFWLDGPFFYSAQSQVARLSDDGSMVIHLLKYLGLGESRPEHDLQQLERAMDILQPGWRAEEVARQYLPNLTAIHDFNAVASAGRTRGPAVPEVPGLYVAGDWLSHGEVLVDVAFASAKRAAQAIVADHRAPATTGGAYHGDRRAIS